jgi:hypothetical protein
MHGKQQLTWSRGLKKKFCIAEQSDQEISNQINQDSVYLGAISYEGWQKILKHNVRGEILEYANLGGINAVLSYIDHLD